MRPLCTNCSNVAKSRGLSRKGLPSYHKLCHACHYKKYKMERHAHKRRLARVPAPDRKAQAIAYLGGKCMNKACPVPPTAILHQSVFDFHHRDQTVKDGDIAKLIRRLPWARVLAELDKCDLLCCLCHRTLHATPAASTSAKEMEAALAAELTQSPSVCGSRRYPKTASSPSVA